MNNEETFISTPTAQRGLPVIRCDTPKCGIINRNQGQIDLHRLVLMLILQHVLSQAIMSDLQEITCTLIGSESSSRYQLAAIKFGF